MRTSRFWDQLIVSGVFSFVSLMGAQYSYWTSSINTVHNQHYYWTGTFISQYWYRIDSISTGTFKIWGLWEMFHKWPSIDTGHPISIFCHVSSVQYQYRSPHIENGSIFWNLVSIFGSHYPVWILEGPVSILGQLKYGTRQIYVNVWH